METPELEQLLERCRPHLVRVLYRYRIPTQDAEDLLQETFLILIGKWESIHSPEAWLAATLRNRCVIYWRRRRARIYELVDEAILELLSRGEPPAQERAEVRRDLAVVLGRLEPRHREILHLRFALGCTSGEIGERLGYEAGSVRKITQRCLARLNRELNRPAAEPEPEPTR